MFKVHALAFATLLRSPSTLAQIEHTPADNVQKLPVQADTATILSWC